MADLVAYYNKFNEDKRLLSRHGQVEFRTSMHYVHKYLELLKEQEGIALDDTSENKFENVDGVEPEKTDAKKLASGNGKVRILDVGAGTGRYSVALAEEGYDVTAVELVKSNLGQLKKKNANVKAYQGNALKLKRFEDNSFDLTILFGPMYHLHSFEDKAKALTEAARVTRDGGYILVAYVMNEYSILTYGFKEGHLLESQQKGAVDETFQVVSNEQELYDYIRLSDIEKVNEMVPQVRRAQIIAPDGAADYMRQILNEMSDELFEQFCAYQLSVSDRADLLGASSHTVDILQVTK